MRGSLRRCFIWRTSFVSWTVSLPRYCVRVLPSLNHRRPVLLPPGSHTIPCASRYLTLCLPIYEIIHGRPVPTPLLRRLPSITPLFLTRTSRTILKARSFQLTRPSALFLRANGQPIALPTRMMCLGHIAWSATKMRCNEHQRILTSLFLCSSDGTPPYWKPVRINCQVNSKRKTIKPGRHFLFRLN